MQNLEENQILHTRARWAHLEQLSKICSLCDKAPVSVDLLQVYRT